VRQAVGAGRSAGRSACAGQGVARAARARQRTAARAHQRTAVRARRAGSPASGRAGSPVPGKRQENYKRQSRRTIKK
jgi:hypothetical protein